MFCSSCGTNLPDRAAFCSTCGKATAGSSSSGTTGVEYETVWVDWSSRPPLYTDSAQMPPHPEAYATAFPIVEKRLHEDLSHYYRDGWSLDGPFRAAVSFATRNKTSMWRGGNRHLYVGATVRLRRTR